LQHRKRKIISTTLNTVKNRIKTILDNLKTDGVLGDVQMDDFKKSVFARDVPAYPVAILTTPAIESAADTNRSNLRTYTFDVLVLSRAEDVTDSAEIEDLIENILNEFDNDPTLKAGSATGIADGGLEPSASSPEAVSSGERSYIAFTVTLRARATRDLTFV